MHSDKFRSARPPLHEPGKAGTTYVEGPSPADPVQQASQRIRSVDASGTEASGSTIDTDGKSQEAAKNPSLWQDNVIYSNASLVNTNPEPDPEAPIAGIDSRRSQGQPTVAPDAGHKLVHRGVVDETVRNGTRAAQRFSLEDDDAPDAPDALDTRR
ncbi:DUF3005 domain-containing protein [Ralstonia sp. SET104]|uniref:DUF3005 domain-containing protein n=1 Tax=Ralstonia sp. SET104 TaxID=2448774 RepID=UPI000F57EBD0|nr:DUF3005 domain-containing protein [Ralstonia sp. SET104]GCB06466.1 hypothetical protein PSUB009319_40970 [Ralstonia sp. SET104]